MLFRSDRIPARFTCDGPGPSPAIEWRDAPTGTKSFALIVDDPDAPRDTFTHWVLADIPASATGVAEGFKPGNLGVSGLNDFGQPGYGGPCPPSGTHRYVFKLYALDVETLGLKEGASRDEVERTMLPHVIGKAELIGKY